MPAPEMLNFRFEGINPWRQRGNFPVRKAQIKLVPNIRVQHMLYFDIFRQLYFMKYIKDVIVPENKTRLNSPMVIWEYFHVIGYRIIMACYFAHSIRDFFWKDFISQNK